MKWTEQRVVVTRSEFVRALAMASAASLLRASPESAAKNHDFEPVRKHILQVIAKRAQQWIGRHHALFSPAFAPQCDSQGGTGFPSFEFRFFSAAPWLRCEFIHPGRPISGIIVLRSKLNGSKRVLRSNKQFPAFRNDLPKFVSPT